MFGRAVLCCDTVLYCTVPISAPEGHREYYVLYIVSYLCIRVVLKGIC